MGSGTGMSTSFERDRQEEGKLLTHSTIASDDTEVLGLARRILILFGSYIFNRICHFAVWLSCDAKLVVPSFAALRPEQRTALITGLSLLVFRIVVLIIEVYMASLPSLAFDHLVQELEVKSMQVHIKTYCMPRGWASSTKQKLEESTASRSPTCISTKSRWIGSRESEQRVSQRLRSRFRLRSSSRTEGVQTCTKRTLSVHES